MTTQTISPNDVLMGGEKVPSAKFPNPGDTITGTIVGQPQAYQVRTYDDANPGGGEPRFYKSGDPIMALFVDLATDLRDPQIEEDDGTRRLYIESRFMKEAVREAVKAAGAPGLSTGGKLTLSFTHREDPMNKQSRKYWQAQYVPAANTALMAETAMQQVATPAVQQPAMQQAAMAVQQAVQAPSPAPAASTPIQQVPAQPPAGQPVGGLAPADMARQLLMLGNPETTVAQMTGLDPSVVAQLHAAIATPQQ